MKTKARLIRGDKFNVINKWGEVKDYIHNPEVFRVETHDLGDETYMSVRGESILSSNNVRTITDKYITYYEIDTFGEIHDYKFSTKRIKFI